MQLSVVIVSFQAKYFLELCLYSVLKASQNIEIEIIVVDNCSTDGTNDLVQSKFKTVKLIKNTQNLGFAKANNIGVSKACGDYVLILNPDTVLAEDTFIKCLEFANLHPDLGALGVKLIDGAGHFLPEGKRNLPTPLVSFYKMLGIKNKKYSYYAQQIPDDSVGEVAILVGAFMFLKRANYLAVGGFDTDYFMYGEDIDFSYKLTKSGFKNYYLGTASVIHFKGESTKKNTRYLKHFFKAMPLFYGKHFKRNLAFEWFLKLGIYGWFIAKYLQLKFAKSSQNCFKRAVYFGSEQSTLTLLKNKFNTMQINQINNQNELADFDLMFVDLSMCPFKTMIQILEKYKSPQHKFRIILPNTQVVIGSDSPSDKGAVTLLNEGF